MTNNVPGTGTSRIVAGDTLAELRELADQLPGYVNNYGVDILKRAASCIAELNTRPVANRSERDERIERYARKALECLKAMQESDYQDGKPWRNPTYLHTIDYLEEALKAPLLSGEEST